MYIRMDDPTAAHDSAKVFPVAGGPADKPFVEILSAGHEDALRGSSVEVNGFFLLNVVP